MRRATHSFCFCFFFFCHLFTLYVNDNAYTTSINIVRCIGLRSFHHIINYMIENMHIIRIMCAKNKGSLKKKLTQFPFGFSTNWNWKTKMEIKFITNIISIRPNAFWLIGILVVARTNHTIQISREFGFCLMAHTNSTWCVIEERSKLCFIILNCLPYVWRQTPIKSIVIVSHMDQVQNRWLGFSIPWPSIKITQSFLVRPFFIRNTYAANNNE